MKTTEITIREKTSLEGVVEYRARWGGWERVGAHVDHRYEMFFADAETFSWDMTAVDERVFEVAGVETDEDLWRELGQIWMWLGANGRFDPRGYYQYFLDRPGAGWPTMAQYAARIQNGGRFPFGACFSTAHILASLWHHAGLSTWRHLMVGARHSLTSGSDPRHWYNALFIDGDWTAVDPAGVLRYGWPENVGQHILAHGTAVDYVHPNRAVALPGGPDFVPIMRRADA